MQTLPHLIKAHMTSNMTCVSSVRAREHDHTLEQQGGPAGQGWSSWESDTTEA